MVKGILSRSKSLLYSRQESIFSAATIIMVMVAASRLLGLVRYRTFAHFFPPERLDTFLAAFQIPDMIFEIVVLGTMSSAFIPVFSVYLGKKKRKEGWYVAGVALNIMLLFFLIFGVVIFIFAPQIYSLVLQGFAEQQVEQTVFFARILLLSQLFFTASYLLTATLESNQRFLAPAVAPLFYNLSIIVATLLFANRFGLIAPVVGAVFGSLLHLGIQLPLAASLGFRPVWKLDFANAGVRAIAKLAAPRVIELSFFQIKKVVDLAMASLVAGGLTYFKFGESLAALPIGLFGLSIAKASLPQLSKQTVKEDLSSFKETFSSSFKEILFLVLPAAVFLIVLRIPAVRLIFGGAKFDWEDTVQTGYVVSAFAVGILAYALSLLVSRSFYALHNTATPVKISIMTIFINVGLGLFFILGLKLPIWGLALAYALAGIVQVVVLIALLSKKIGGFRGLGLSASFLKMLFASLASGGIMFILLKILDRSAWDKNLSFLGKLGLALPTTFQNLVIDTRYTTNLIMLTFFVGLVGIAIYLGLAHLLRVEEVRVLAKLLRIRRIRKTPKDVEPLIPTPSNGS